VPAQSRRPASASRDRARATAVGLLAGVLLDQLAGDPRRGHPVALFGSAASRLEARMWRDDRAAGTGYAALLTIAPAALGLLARRLPAPWLTAATALGTWTVLGSRSLPAEAEAVAAHLRRGDLPARLTAALTAVVAPVAGGSARRALAVARADGRRHPSPNAGVAEAAFAGALGVRLGGRNDYGSHVEDRPVLGGGGRPPELADIARAARLSRAITVAAAVTGAAIALARARGR
jgi:adenosylcobinamide-phosphate synthase